MSQDNNTNTNNSESNKDLQAGSYLESTKLKETAGWDSKGKRIVDYTPLNVDNSEWIKTPIISWHQEGVAVEPQCL